MTNEVNKKIVDKYNNLTKLEKEVFHHFHNDILASGTCWTNVGVNNPQDKGALGSLVKKGLLIFQETDGEGFELYSSALIEEVKGAYTSIIPSVKELV
jgi:hypothetical protein